MSAKSSAPSMSYTTSAMITGHILPRGSPLRFLNDRVSRIVGVSWDV
jgi:hypothetical protein